MQETLMTMREVQSACGGLASATIRRMIRAGGFPKPIVLSKRSDGLAARVAWRASDIEAWIFGRCAVEA